jgi:hypothetical protein
MNMRIELAAAAARWLGLALLLSSGLATAQPSAFPCDPSVTQINAKVSITKTMLQTPPPTEGWINHYYTGWNGTCWSYVQDAFTFQRLGAGPFTYQITILDTQGAGFKFTDTAGSACLNATALDPTKAVVFAKIGNNGRVSGDLLPWPIPGLSEKEKGEYSGFSLSTDGKILSFVDRDNTGPDYHFGVQLCDPSNGETGRPYVFVSDPGQQSKGTGNR